MNSTPMLQTWPHRMLDVLHDQQSIVDELAGLASRQSDLIESNRTDALLTLLSERQQLIDRFAASQQAMAELAAEGDDGVEGRLIDPDQRQHMRDLVDAISDRLAEVLRVDEADQQRLERSRESVRTEMNTMGRAAQARQAYGGAATASRFADQKG